MADFTLDKSLPNNTDAERAVLGSILLDNGMLNQAAEKLKREDFFLESHRRIFDQMLKLFERGQTIDPIALVEGLKQAGDLEAVGGVAYVSQLFTDIPRFANVESYARIIKDKSILRRLITASNSIMSICFDDEEDAEKVLDKAESMILAVGEDRIKQGFVHIARVADAQFAHIEQLQIDKNKYTGIETGFEDLDRMTAGLQRGELIIIAARPSMGKTALSLNIAQNAATRMHYHGRKAIVGIFSLEMSKEQLVQRLLCAQARIDAHKLRVGNITSMEEWRKLGVAVGELSSASIFLDDTPGLSVLEMRAKARRLKSEQKGLDLLIVDYLQLMSGRGRTESRQQEVSQISRELKLLAKELDIPLIALSQLSRAPENRTEKQPQLADLRDSGSIEQDADVVMFIYRDEVYDPETTRVNIADINLAKQRNGPTGKVELVFLKQFTRFENLLREYHQ